MKRKAFYCAKNDILIRAPNFTSANKYARHRLSPAYGFAADRADSLALQLVSAAKANDLDGYAITWEIDEF